MKQVMSAIGTKRTYRVALHMSAFGGKGTTSLGALGLLGWRRKRRALTAPNDRIAVGV
jgi:hypothetical protein